jgi:hypothetical protein
MLFSLFPLLKNDNDLMVFFIALAAGREMTDEAFHLKDETGLSSCA